MTSAEVVALRDDARKAFQAFGDMVTIGITKIGAGFGFRIGYRDAPQRDTPREFRGIPVIVEVVGSPKTFGARANTKVPPKLAPQAWK